MKNLKRILSLALASTMLVGMLVVGANAATFSDSDKITHADAVDTLVALGVMNGMGDGTFNPQGTLTRAQMAKLLATVFNNGDDDLSFAVNEAKPTFSDVAPTSWYAGYVEYAANFKIVNGNGDGTFSPEGKLTVAQAARMVLNAMGYAQGEGDWKLNTIIQAREVGIFAGLSADEQSTNAEMTRDAAAQMLNTALGKPLNNAAVSSEVVYKLTGKDKDGADKVFRFETSTDAYLYASVNEMTEVEVTKTTNKVSETLGTKYLDLKATVTGRVTAVTKDETKDAYTVTVTPDDAEEGTLFSGLKADYADMLGRTVKVLYKTTSSVYGINPVGTVAGTIDGSEWDDKVSEDPADKADYTLNSAVFYKNGNSASDKDDAAIAAGSIVELIDENGDDKIELVRVVNKSVATLGADPELDKDGKKVTITNDEDAAIVDEVEIEKVVGYKDLKEGDVVLYVDINGTITLEKAEVTTGKVTAANTDRTEYTVGGKTLGYSALTGATSDEVVDADEKTDFKTEYDFYLDNGGNIVKFAPAGKVPAAEAKYAVTLDFGYVTTGASTAIGGSAGVTTIQVQLLFTDGSTDVVEMTSYKNESTKYVNKATAGTGETAITTEGDSASFGAFKTAATNKLVKYTEKDGKYTLESVADNASNQAITGGKPAFASGKVGNKDTLFLLKLGTGDKIEYKVVTGIADLPSAKADGHQATVMETVTKDGLVTMAYLVIEAVDGKTTKETAYFIDNAKATETADGYKVQAIVDGELKDVTIATDSYDTIATEDEGGVLKGLAEVTYDADGKITAAEAIDDATELTAIEMVAELVKEEGGEHYQVAADAVIYKITNKVESVAVDKLAAAIKTAPEGKQFNAVVELADDDDHMITTMYITVVDA